MKHGETHVKGWWLVPAAAFLSACSALPMMSAHTSGFAGAGGTDGRRGPAADPYAEQADGAGAPARVAMGPFFDFGRMSVREFPATPADPNAVYRLPGASLALDNEATVDSLLKAKASALPTLRPSVLRADDRTPSDTPQ